MWPPTLQGHGPGTRLGESVHSGSPGASAAHLGTKVTYPRLDVHPGRGMEKRTHTVHGVS